MADNIGWTDRLSAYCRALRRHPSSSMVIPCHPLSSRVIPCHPPSSRIIPAAPAPRRRMIDVAEEDAGGVPVMRFRSHDDVGRNRRRRMKGGRRRPPLVNRKRISKTKGRQSAALLSSQFPFSAAITDASATPSGRRSAHADPAATPPSRAPPLRCRRGCGSFRPRRPGAC